MRLRRDLIWIPLALAGALAAASLAIPAYAQSWGYAPQPAPYLWHHGRHGYGWTYGPFTGQSCYADTLNGRVCVD
jgi:hypothetical protein